MVELGLESDIVVVVLFGIKGDLGLVDFLSFLVVVEEVRYVDFFISLSIGV